MKIYVNKKHIAIIFLIAFFSILIYITSVFFRQNTLSEGLKKIADRSIDNSSFDLRFAHDSQSVYIGVSFGILQYDIKGVLKNDISFEKNLIAFTLNDDGTELGCLFLDTDDIVFMEIDSKNLKVLNAKKLPIDMHSKSISRSMVVWSESGKAWITYLGHDKCGDHCTNDCLFAWSQHSLNKEAELLLGENYFFTDTYNNIYPIPGTDSIIALDSFIRSKLWDYKHSVVIDKPFREDAKRCFIGPFPETYATLDGKVLSVFQYETDSVVCQSLPRSLLPDEDRMFHNPGTIVDVAYSSNKALFIRQGGPMLFELPACRLLIVFDIPSMKIIASEKSNESHFIDKAIISQNGQYVATIENWKNNRKGLVNRLNIYEIEVPASVQHLPGEPKLKVETPKPEKK